MRHSFQLSMGILLAGLLVFTALGSAQVTTARLYGTVEDSTGAVIPGVQVTVTNDDTGLVYTAESGASGDFVFNVLPVGTYTLRLEAEGFKAYESTGIDLVASQVVNQTHVLEIGDITETVSVEGRPPLVSTVASEQTESLDSFKVTETSRRSSSFPAGSMLAEAASGSMA